MATWPLAPVAPPLGVPADPDMVRVMNRTGSAVVVGEVVQFDLHSTDAAVTDYTTGSDNSVLANVIAVAATGLTKEWLGIVQEAALDDAPTVVCVRGKTKALVESASGGGGAAALTDILTATTASISLDTDAAANNVLERIVGIPLETSAAAASELIDILFNGIEGFGFVYTHA